MHFDGVSLHVCAKNHPLLMEGMWHLIFHWIPSYFGTSTFISSRFFFLHHWLSNLIWLQMFLFIARAGQDDLQRSFPTGMILWFCNSISGWIVFGFPSPPGLTGIYTGCCAPMGLSHGLGWKIISCQLDMAASFSHSLCGVCSFWGVHSALLAPFLTPFCQTPCQWDTAEETCYQAAPSYAT